MHAAHSAMPMEPIHLGPRTSSALNAYRVEQMMNLSAVEVIHRLYSVGIQAIKKNDLQLAQRAINELIGGLNFEYHEVALTLYRLYQYAKQCLREGKTREALGVLEELRAAWSEAFKL